MKRKPIKKETSRKIIGYVLIICTFLLNTILVLPCSSIFFFAIASLIGGGNMSMGFTICVLFAIGLIPNSIMAITVLYLNKKHFKYIVIAMFIIYLIQCIIYSTSLTNIPGILE